MADYTKEELEAAGLDAGLINNILDMQGKANKGATIEHELQSFFAKVVADPESKKALRGVFDKHGVKIDLPESPLEKQLESVQTELGKTREEINNDKLVSSMHGKMRDLGIPAGEFNKIVEWANANGLGSVNGVKVVELYAQQRVEELPSNPSMGYRFKQEGVPTMEEAYASTLSDLKQFKTARR